MTDTGERMEEFKTAVEAQGTTVEAVDTSAKNDRFRFEARLDRAEELGIHRDIAEERLDRLVTLDMLDIDDGYVYPDTNVSRI